MKKLYLIQLIIFLLVFNFRAEAQTYLAGYESEYRYFKGISEPDSAWNNSGFIDGPWTLATGSIGFGDNDDNIIISPVTSVYLRIPFIVENKDALKELVLEADYDDGYVAYLNGIEIVRVNMGAVGTSTTYNQLATRSHEAEFYRVSNSGQAVLPILGYFLDSTMVSQALVDGQNYLCIEVHNDSLLGSDLSFACALWDFTNVEASDYSYMFNDQFRFKKQVQLDSTILPIIKIETDEFGIMGKRNEVMANLGIIDNGIGIYNKPEQNLNGHSGPISIEIRGESSAHFPKQSFNIELKDEDLNDTSVSLLGMPREGDWILQGPWADKSQFRNAFVYELGRKTGHWTPRTRFCELIINDQFMGLYTLVEKIKRDSNRVDISKLFPEEIDGNDLTGGYIIKYDKGNSNLQIVYPKEKDIQQEQIDYINGYFAKYYSVLNSNLAFDPDSGYRKYINEYSLIDLMVVTEIVKNCDSYYISSYMFKDKDSRDSRINFGPLWDFDLSIGNSIWQNGAYTNDWQFNFPQNQKFKIRRLLQDTSLVNLFSDRWFELRNNFLRTDSLMNDIDSFVSELELPIKRNYEVWPVIDQNLFAEAYHVNTYEEEITYMKNWLSDRINWVDTYIDSIFYPVQIITSVQNLTWIDQSLQSVYPNPFSDQLTMQLNLQENAMVSFEVFDIAGRLIVKEENISLTSGISELIWTPEASVKPGFYLLQLNVNGKDGGAQKIFKVR